MEWIRGSEVWVVLEEEEREGEGDSREGIRREITRWTWWTRGSERVRRYGPSSRNTSSNL